MALRVKDASNSFIQKLAQEYLCDFVTMKKLAKIHGTSPGTISNILLKGVAENILNDITAHTVAEKVMNSTENIVRTRKRWQAALNKRELPRLEAELKAKQDKLQELQYQYEAFDDFSFDECNAPSKKTLKCDICRLKKNIENIQKYITNLRS